FVGGTALQAIEVFIGSAMLPTVVAEIGGLELFAWNTTLFVVASILATLFAGARPASIGPRGAYLIAAAGFALGSLLCGIAPSMPVLLLGRTVQGFGAGLLVAMTLSMLRLLFPQHLWPRAMALNSVVWGVATLTGPAIGGVFAELGIWRWAFLSIVPLSGLLALGAVRILPARAPRDEVPVPVMQIVLVTGVVLAVSLASVLENTMASALTLAVAALAIVVLGVVDRRSRSPLLPAGSFSLRSRFAALWATILLLGVAITSDIFAPLLLQRLHGLSPLLAGYVAALVAAGWSTSALFSSGWQGQQVQRAIVAAPVILTASTLAMIVSLGVANPASDLRLLVAAGATLLAMGAGIGMAFQHLSTAVLATATAGDNDRVSAGLGMVQLFASGLGAAIGGVVMNAAGLAQATDMADVEHAARWLFIVFAGISAAGIPFALLVARGRRATTLQAAE
ncbi:MAG TPA: MFS transporter, partial [Devosia sp.]|nr:MFS transporter [Devosia sp.]